MDKSRIIRDLGDDSGWRRKFVKIQSSLNDRYCGNHRVQVLGRELQESRIKEG